MSQTNLHEGSSRKPDRPSGDLRSFCIFIYYLYVAVAVLLLCLLQSSSSVLASLHLWLLNHMHSCYCGPSDFYLRCIKLDRFTQGYEEGSTSISDCLIARFTEKCWRDSRERKKMGKCAMFGEARE